MGHMCFENIEAAFDRALDRGAISIAQPRELVLRQCVRCDPAFVERNGARRDDVPRRLAAQKIVGIKRSIAEPRALHAGLASGMGELDCRHRTMIAQEGCYACERRDMRVAPQTHIAMRDAAVLRHRGCLDHDDAGAAEREAAEMHEMPIVGHAVIGRILAHRRDDDAILGLDAAQF
jgi:hypothetical protein